MAYFEDFSLTVRIAKSSANVKEKAPSMLSVRLRRSLMKILTRNCSFE